MIEHWKKLDDVQDVWMDVAMKLYAVTLVSFVSMSDAWKFTVALCLGMSVLVWVSHPYMHPQAAWQEVQSGGLNGACRETE